MTRIIRPSVQCRWDKQIWTHVVCRNTHFQLFFLCHCIYLQKHSRHLKVRQTCDSKQASVVPPWGLSAHLFAKYTNQLLRQFLEQLQYQMTQSFTYTNTYKSIKTLSFSGICNKCQTSDVTVLLTNRKRWCLLVKERQADKDSVALCCYRNMCEHTHSWVPVRSSDGNCGQLVASVWEKMRLNICSCLLVFFLGCKVTAGKNIVVRFCSVPSVLSVVQSRSFIEFVVQHRREVHKKCLTLLQEVC